MSQFARRLRTPEERVGGLPNASLPPPAAAATPDVDILLLRALRDGEEAAFARALDLLYPPMLRLALDHVRTPDVADEVIQETWLAALDGFHRFEHRSSVRTWLMQILRNVARARGRRDARTTAFSEMGNGSVEYDVAHLTSGDPDAVGTNRALWAGGTDPERQLLSAELADRIQAAIDGLPPRLRQVIVMRDVEGWSAAEVCNILGVTDTNQRVMLHRARDRVRNELQPYLSDVCDDDHPAVP